MPFSNLSEDVMFRTLAATLALTLFSVCASYADEWVRLGEHTVAFSADRDVFHVERQDGRFKRLKLIVRRNDIKLNSIKIRFGNGEVQDLEFDRFMRDGEEAVIDLAHGLREGRHVQNVELRYHSRAGLGGEALAELYGQEAEQEAAPVAQGREWVRLGDRRVGFDNDRDVIHVGREDGKFARLKLIVRGADIKLDSIKIRFANGEAENVYFDSLVRDGGAAVVDIPHGWREGRYIQDVELRYQSRPGDGEALAELFGQEDDLQVTPAVYERDWVRLGDRRVGFDNDRDVIHVGREDGKFTRLKLIVRGNDIKLRSIKILFGNGEVEDVFFDNFVRDGGAAVVEIPHGWREGRFIRDVELHYHSRPDSREQALAELWGQEG